MYIFNDMATTSLILDTRILHKAGTYSLKLRVTHKRHQKYFPLGIKLSKEEWALINQPNPRRINKERKLLINSKEQKAIKIIEGLDFFTFETFRALFYNEPQNSSDAIGLLKQYIKELKNENRLSTAESYQSSLSGFNKYLKKKNRTELLFSDINVRFLNAYEKWMLNKGRSISTVGIHMRNLRTIYNLAIEKGLAKQENYPFTKRRYQIPTTKNIKKALSSKEIISIINYNPKSRQESKARDIWLFSYLANGMNMKDISFLKYKNLTKESIIFFRAKTLRSSKSNLKPIIVPILPELKEIINRWGVRKRSNDTYIFGILNQVNSELEIKRNVNQFTKTTNKYLKRIGEELNLSIKLTTYVARHSFATVLMRSGTSSEFIQQALGHKNIETTENYLGSFELNYSKKVQKNLLLLKD